MGFFVLFKIKIFYKEVKSFIHPNKEIQRGILSETAHEKPTAKLPSRFILTHPQINKFFLTLFPIF